MKKFILVSIGAIVLASLFLWGANSISASLGNDGCPPYPVSGNPYPSYPYPVNPCDLPPSSCGFFDIYNGPLQNPWIFPTRDFAVCRAIIHDKYGYWVFDSNHCIYGGPEGSRCVSGMFETNSIVTIEGPNQFYDVQLYGQYYSWLPAVLKQFR